MLLALAAGLLTSLVGAGFYLRHAPRRALDIPNNRSSHSHAVPRGGGLAIVAGFLVGLSVWILEGNGLSPRALGWLVGSVLIAAIGFVDDLRSLPATPRLIAQLIAAGGLTIVGVQVQGNPLLLAGALALAFIYVVGVTNVYNFMDGIDGLAITQAVIAGVALGVAGGLIANPLLSIGGGLLAVAALGFLPYNRPRAQLFMGDVGSTFLGFSFAGLTLLGSIGVAGGGQHLPLIVGPLLLAPFLFDGGLTLLRRIARGERWYAAHRSHLYQRLVQQGWSHGQVTSLYAGGAAVAATAAVLCVLVTTPMLQVLLAVLAYAPMLGITGLVWRAERNPRRSAQPAETSTVVTQGHS